MPRVSVILPAYNAETYIKEAIDSILEQTFRDFELIVINDCSADGTEDAVLSFNDARIVYLKNEKNLGVARTLNKGLAAARGEYIARMDADDISLPQRLEKQAAYLDAHPNIAVVGTAVERFHGSESLGLRYFAESPELMRLDLLFSCCLAHPSVMLRTAPVRSLGGYAPDFEGLEDYELWWRLSDQWDLAALPQVLLRYRIHPGQVTKNPSDTYLLRLETLKNKQLLRLGLPVDGRAAQSYRDFCMGSKPRTKEEAACFCGFLQSVLDRDLYSRRLARRYFTAVALGVLRGLSPAERLWVSRRTGPVGPLRAILGR